MVELSLKTGKDSGFDRTVAPDLASVGGHVFVDRGFFDRVEEQDKKFESWKTLLLDRATNMKPAVSELRQTMIEEIVDEVKTVWHNSMFAEGMDRPKYLTKAYAVSELADILLHDLFYSRLSDEDIMELDADSIGKMKKAVLASVNTRNSTINKSFFMQGMPLNMGGMGGAGMDPALKEALQKAFQAQQESSEK